MSASKPRSAACVCAQDARLVGVSRICREHVELVCVLADFPPSEPGQFLLVRCSAAPAASPAVRERPRDRPAAAASACLRPAPYLRRPFSIADRWEDRRGRTHLAIISRTVGAGTRWLAGLRPGATLNITGPLGRGFELPGTDVPCVLVGGGVGIPPLLYLTRRLRERGHRRATAVFGAASAGLLPLRFRAAPSGDGTPADCLELPGGARLPAIITTDDGSAGLRGRASDGLRRWDRRQAASARRALVLACGPEPMLRAVAEWTRRRHLGCQLCIERTMGCGLGTCLSCVVRLADPARPAGWRWACACCEGPVFERDALLDYQQPPRP